MVQKALDQSIVPQWRWGGSSHIVVFMVRVVLSCFRWSSAALLSVAVWVSPAVAQKLPADTYRNALAWAETGRLNEARLAVDAVNDPLFDKLLRWLDYTKNRGGSQFSELASFIDGNPDWPNQAALRKRAEELLRLEPDPARILAWVQKSPPASRDGRIAEALALRATGRDADATRLLRRVWVEDAFGSVEETEFLKQYGGVLTPADESARLDRLLWRGQADPVKRQMARVDPTRRALAEARLRFQSGAPVSGPQGVDAIFQKLPPTLRNDPGLLYDRVKQARKVNDDATARQILTQGISDPVRPDLWWLEREPFARKTIDAGDLASAYKIVAQHGLPTTSPDWSEAEWMAGWVALKQRNSAVAMRHFAAALDQAKTPISKARAGYWAGMAAEIGPKPADAKIWFERAGSHVATFYGQLALARLGRVDSLRLPADPKPIPGAEAAFANRETVQIVNRLIAIGEIRRIDPFLLRLAEIAPDPQTAVLAAAVANRQGRLDLAALIGRRTLRDTGTLLIEANYPILPIESSGPELALVHGLIRQESNFMVDVVSRAGAKGLMQLMPGTARETAGKIGIAYLEPKLTQDIAYNTLLGQAYLARVLDGFNGSYVLALAGYNAGPGRVRQWISARGDPRQEGVDLLDWIEGIPFSETRGYVQRVLESTVMYRLRLAQGNRSTPPTSTVSALGPSWCLAGCPQIQVALDAPPAPPPSATD